MQVGLTTPLVHALGARTGKRLADKLSLGTVGDLLRHYPRRYTEQGKLTDLSSLQEGEKATILGEVKKVTDRRPRYPSKVRLITEVVVTDGKREISCTFFNQFKIAKDLRPGTEAVFAGTVSRFRKTLQISSPTWEAVRGAGPGETIDTIESFAGGILPLYPLTEGITQVFLQQCIRTALEPAGRGARPGADRAAGPARPDRSRRRPARHAPAPLAARPGSRAAAAAVRRGAVHPAGAGPAPGGSQGIPGRTVPADPRGSARGVRPKRCRSR